MNRQFFKLFPVPIASVENFISEQERQLILKEIIEMDLNDLNGKINKYAFLII